MHERSAAEHDPAQAGEQYVSLAMTVARKISYINVKNLSV